GRRGGRCTTMLRSQARGGRLIAHSAIPAVLALILMSCATRPGPEVLAPVGAMPGIKTVPIYVATTRARATPSGNVFTAERANTLNFAKFVVAVPLNHQPGTIEWPQGAPDPRSSFATVEQEVLSDATFRDTVASPRRGKRQNVLVFVHGYNNN